MKNKQKLLAGISIACAFAIVIGGVFAFFSDTANLTESIKVGNVDISVDGDLFHSNGLNNLNPGDNDPDLTTDHRPGTDHELSFTVTNNGNKSVITRTVIEVSGLRVDGTTVLTEAELMNLILSEKANITAQTTADTIASSDTGKQTEVVRLTPTGYSDNKLVYVISHSTDILNGTGDDAETEANVNSNSLVKTFDIGLDADTSAELYESATITLTVKVEAMQYRNTSDAEWDTIFEKSYTTSGTPEVTTPAGAYYVDGSFKSWDSLLSEGLVTATEITASSSFKEDTTLKSIIVPEGVTIISNLSFSGCSNLENVTLPNSIKTLGQYSFEACTSLTNIVIPDSVTTIASYAFSGCDGITFHYSGTDTNYPWGADNATLITE